MKSSQMSNVRRKKIQLIPNRDKYIICMKSIMKFFFIVYLRNPISIIAFFKLSYKYDLFVHLTQMKVHTIHFDSQPFFSSLPFFCVCDDVTSWPIMIIYICYYMVIKVGEE